MQHAVNYSPLYPPVGDFEAARQQALYRDEGGAAFGWIQKTESMQERTLKSLDKKRKILIFYYDGLILLSDCRPLTRRAEVVFILLGTQGKAL